MSTELANRDSTEIAKPNDAVAGKEYALGVLKGTIGAIPYVGTLLNEILFEARSRVKQQRLEALFREVAQAVETLTEENIDRKYLGSDEFSDLFEEVAQRAAQTRDERKQAYFKNVLLKGIQGKQAPEFSSMFLALLHEITEEELSVLAGFARGVEWLKEEREKARQAGKQHPNEVARMKPIDWSQETICGFPKQAYREMVQSLIRKGLVFDDSHGRLSTPPFTCLEGTDLGARFYEWITT